MATKALTLYETTIGKKAVMAASGIILLGFTLGHLSGNLKAYAGPTEYNEYARWLRLTDDVAEVIEVLEAYAASREGGA